MARSLYICYFGVEEPLVQTQVIPYLRELSEAGHEISLVTFEGRPKELKGERLAALKKELAEKGIDWHWLKYHKRFSVLATTYDILRGTIFVRRMIRKRDLDILHGRAHVPTLMGALGRKLARGKPKLLFDIRGFFPEEYTDAGIWPENGWLYRSAKRVERWLIKESDGFVVLTAKAREILFPGSEKTGSDDQNRPVEVIPCCVDLGRFEAIDEETRSEIRRQLNIDGRPVLVYVGSFGGWYLSDEMLEFSKVAREVDPGIFFLILTQRDQENVRRQLAAQGFTDRDFLVEGVKPEDIGNYLAAGDIAVSFIKPCYSKLASSPTKLAEYLACGLPVVANAGVGDVDRLIEGEKVGVVFDRFDDATYRTVFKTASAMAQERTLRDRCRQTAKNHFDLRTVAGNKYKRIYRRLQDTSS